MLDLLIRGGLVVDGTGLPGYRADLGIRDGRITEIGRIQEGAARTIDAGGLVVAPGLIDHHTHLDAQLLWDPYGTSEPQHGVTTVVTGNCGLTLAPVVDESREALVKSLARVEAIPRESLEEGVGWGWSSYGEYLDGFENKVGINVGGLVGHIAVRHRVMGEEAVEREAEPVEVERMRQLLHESLRGGALGMSTNRNKRHMREDGKPVASRLASEEELLSLTEVARDLNAGIILCSSDTPLELVEKLARRSERPVVWQSVQHLWNDPDRWRQQLEFVERVFADGYRTFGIANALPIIVRFDMKTGQTFDEFQTWKQLMFLPVADRLAAFKDPATRKRMAAEWDEPRMTVFHKRWDLIDVLSVARPEHEALIGRSVTDIAREQGKDPLDAYLDLCIAEDLATEFTTVGAGGDAEAMQEILRSPYVLIGLSDAGAHVQFGASFGYGTEMLARWVRQRNAFRLEEAIQKLTSVVARVYGLRDRGQLEPGMAADVIVFDPTTVQPCEPEWAEDFPARTRRLVQRCEGMHFTIVNGKVICEDGRLTGDLPGKVLRGAAYAA
ncbi:MAG: amidohydrolase family protein [Chloroflexi bacterium]|nr:amidohydrolase family protein [Chloroflexota bacterium]